MNFWEFADKHPVLALAFVCIVAMVLPTLKLSFSWRSNDKKNKLAESGGESKGT